MLFAAINLPLVPAVLALAVVAFIAYSLIGEVLDWEGGTYRLQGNFGDVHGVPSLNEAIVDYTQIRFGGGASWKIRPELTLEIEAGVVPVQEFDFHRAGVKARSTEIPPYGGLVLKAAF